MVKARTWFTLGIIALGTIGATASCGGSDEGTVSSAGSGGGGIIPGGGSTSRAGSTGRAGSSGAAAVDGDGALGSKCSGDVDCNTGLKCLTPDTTEFGSGGPSLGMCNLPCTTPEECDAVSPGAECFNWGTQAAPVLYCLAACTQGAVETDAEFAAKCQGRPDFTCQDFTTSTDTKAFAFCTPHCRADVECGPDLFCNQSSGMCSPTKSTGAPIGTACTPGATTPTCDGVCLGTSATDDTQGVCTQLCSGFLPCNYGSGTEPKGWCAGKLSTQFGEIDTGYCLPTCGCTSDCPYPGDMCRAWQPGDTPATLFTDPGLCFVNVTGSTELSCGEGGAGGAGGADGVGDAGMGGTAP